MSTDGPEPGPTEWSAGAAGVGPWSDTHPGQTPDDPRFDPDLLEHGDSRNVVDAYRYWRRAEIVADIDHRRHALHVAIENFGNDANIGAVVRTANAFAVHTVHIVGRRRWNRRGAMVTDRYQHVRHHASVEEFVDWTRTCGLGKDGGPLPIIGIDNVPGCQKIEEFDLPEACVLLFGQEGPGLSELALEASDAILEITQFGSTRSINASAAAAITMHCWIEQHVFKRR
jgi:tRNA G18 (ribose-2'-O)-methylase SpoU